MKHDRRMSLRTSNLVAPIVMLVVLVLLATGLNLGLRRQAAAARLVEQSDEVIARGNELTGLVLDMETGVRGYQLTGDQSFLQPYQSGRPAFVTELATTRALVRDNPAQVARLDDVNATMQRWFVDVAAPSIAREEQGTPVDLSEVQVGKARIDEARASLSDFITTERSLADQRSAIVQTITDFSAFMTIIGVLAAVALSMLASAWSLRAVLRPIRELAAAVAARSSGEQRGHVRESGDDELTVLARAFNRMTDLGRASEDEVKERNQQLERERLELEAANEEMQNQAAQLSESLLRVSVGEERERAVNRIHELAEGGQTAVESASRLLPLLLDEGQAQVGALLLRRADALVPLATSGLSDDGWSVIGGLAGRALAENRVVQTLYSKPSGRLSGFAADAYLGCELAMPLPGDNGQLLGVLILGRLASNEFDADRISLLILLAAQVSLAVQRSLLVEALQRDAEQETVLNRINSRIRLSLEIEEVADLAAEELRRVLGSSRCLIAVQSSDGSRVLRQSCAPGVEEAQIEAESQLLYVGRAKDEGHTVAIADVTTDPWLRGLGVGSLRRMLRNRVRAVLAEPLKFGDEVVGAVSVHQCDTPRQWAPDEIAMIQSAAGEVALAVANSRLYRQAQTALEEVRTQGVQVKELNEKLRDERDMLQRERDTLQAVLEASDEAIAVTTEAEDLLLVNPRFNEIFGMSADATPAERNQAIMESLADAAAATALSEQIKENPDAEYRGEIELTRPIPRTLDFFLTPVKRADGSTLGRLVIMRDITKFKEVDRLKDELISVVNHELRTPMASVLGFTELLLTRALSEEKQRLYLETIHQDAERLSTLINDFLDVQRLESDQQQWEVEPCAPLNLVTRALAPFRDQSPSHDFVLNVADALPSAHADAARTIQVLTNLLSNAIKYAPNGGTVTISAAARDRMIRFEVADEGLGIPAEAIPRLFSRFYRVNSGDRRHIGGTGLGLAICKRIVEMQGGQIGVASIHGAGSEFWFTLPQSGVVAIPPATPVSFRAQNPPPDGQSNQAHGLVLVVEDDENLAQLLDIQLTQGGYSVARASTGKEALAMIARERPSAVLLDIVLSGSPDGWQILSQLKADGRTSSIPVVVVSVLDERGHGMALGAAEYLVKPVNRQRLLDVLDRLSVPPRSRVLIVDDDPSIRQLLRESLEQVEFVVEEATGGDEALTAVERFDPNLVILDLIMPGRNGFAVLRELRDRPQTEHLPVIVLTAKDLTSEERQTLSKQMAVLVGKQEFRGQQIVDLVRAMAGPQSPN